MSGLEHRASVPVDDLRSSGLLWLFNTTALHHRGFALAQAEDGTLSLLTLGTDEAYVFSDEAAQEGRAKLEATLSRVRRAIRPEPTS